MSDTETTTIKNENIKATTGANTADAGKPKDDKARKAANLLDLYLWFAIPLLIVLILRAFIIGFYVIPSGSMETTIQPGDRVMTSQLARGSVQRGDVIVFKDPAGWLARENGGSGDSLIKRVIGLPGDHVSCQGAGQPITVNGVAIDETPYLKNGVNPSDTPFDVTVTENHVFVMGDNRPNSADSRYHQSDGANGLVPTNSIQGVATLTYWPLNRIGILESHHEVFDGVPDPS